MTDAMPLDEPIQEPAPGKIERLTPPGADARQTIGPGFDAVEEDSAEAPRPLMREMLPAEAVPRGCPWNRAQGRNFRNLRRG